MQQICIEVGCDGKGCNVAAPIDLNCEKIRASLSEESYDNILATGEDVAGDEGISEI